MGVRHLQFLDLPHDLAVDQQPNQKTSGKAVTTIVR